MSTTARNLPSLVPTRFQRAAIAFVAASALATAASAFQAVHVVTGGGPGALQSAIDAALDGDTILVHSGTYGPVAIAGKTLNLVAEPIGLPLVEGLTVSGLAAGQHVVVSGLRVVAPAITSFAPPDCMRIVDCAGSVRLESVTASLVSPNGNPALRVVNSSDVALTRSNLRGSDGGPSTVNFAAWNPGAGIASTQSNIALYDTRVVGGWGLVGFAVDCGPTAYTFPSTDGAHAIDLDDASIFLCSSGSQITGGRGGNGRASRCDCFLSQLIVGTNGMRGGNAIHNPTGSLAYRNDTFLAAGAGGSGSGTVNCGSGPGGATTNGQAGEVSTNPLGDWPGPALRIDAPTILRTGETALISMQGAPGDSVFLVRSFEARWVPSFPALGVLLTGPSGRRIPVGIVPASGTVFRAVGPASLPPGAQSQAWFLQVFSRDPLGALHVGAGAVTTVVDAAF